MPEADTEESEREKRLVKKGQVAEGIAVRMDFPNKGMVRVCRVFNEIGEAESAWREFEEAGAAKLTAREVCGAVQAEQVNSDGTVQPGQANSDGTVHSGLVNPGRTAKQGGELDERSIVHVKNVLPGQYVRCRITKKRSGKCEGQLLEVLRQSEMEQASSCPHAGICGGCMFRTLPYEEQLKLKEQQVKKLLDAACEDPAFEGIIPSPVEEGYRNKMEFSFGDAYKGGPLSLGLHKRGSFYDIITTDGCRIVDEDYRAVLKTVLELCREWKLPYYHRTSHTGYLRYLLVRKAAFTGQILVALITSRNFTQEISGPEDHPAMEEAEPDDLKNREETGQDVHQTEEAFEQELLKRLLALSLSGSLTGVFHMFNDSVADVASSEESKLLYGQDHITERLLGLQFRITPFSFFQTNSRGAEVLYSKVREYIGDIENKVIFDLYSGTGTIAQILAPVAQSVTGVEIVGEAVEAARENAAANGLSNCTFLEGDVLKVVDELTRKPDLIVLDPPRDGIHPKALPKIIKFGVDRIVYVSCKPTSLARDLEMLQAAGYRVERSCCVDMFPATANVETVIRLSWQKPQGTGE